MSRRGSSQFAPAPGGRPPADAGSPRQDRASPPAARSARTRWRDPRLALGIAVVAVCGLLGARLLGAADDTVGVWAARHALAGGAQVSGEDLVRRQVRFGDQADADRYLSADQPVPDGARLARDVGSGELVPRAALGSGATAGVTEVPLSVATEAVPLTLAVGDVVDVWVTPDATVRAGGPGAGQQAEARSTLLFDDVSVVAAPRSGTSLGPSATRQVIVGIGKDQQGRLPTALAALSSGTVVLTSQR